MHDVRHGPAGGRNSPRRARLPAGEPAGRVERLHRHEIHSRPARSQPRMYFQPRKSTIQEARCRVGYPRQREINIVHHDLLAIGCPTSPSKTVPLIFILNSLLSGSSGQATLADVFQVHVVGQTVPRTFAPVARLLDSTERCCLGRDQSFVDTQDSALESPCNA
jgi:hypothetical protein